MTILSTATLQAVVQNLVTHGSWQRAAAACDPPVSESVCYYWLAQSKRAQKSNQTESPYLFEWMDETRWFSEHARRARALQIFGTEAEIREQLRHGRVELCYDPATGRPLKLLNPEYEHLTDEQFSEFFEPLTGEHPEAHARYLWNYDEAGKRTSVRYQTKQTHLPASLAQAALRATNQIYKDTSTIDVNHRGAVMNITVSPAPFVPRISPPVDAEFRELPIERPDIAALRAQAAKLLADPNRATLRATRPVDLGNSRGSDLPPTRSDGADRDGATPPAGSAATPPTVHDEPRQARAPVARARAPVEMAPESKPAPSYQRRHSQWGADPAADPTRPGAICAKIA